MTPPDWAEDIAFQVHALLMPGVVADDELLVGLAHIAQTLVSAVEARGLRRNLERGALSQL